MNKDINRSGFRAIVLLSLFSFLLSNQGITRHIVGGDITYKCLGMNAGKTKVRMEFTMKIYRDCASGGAEFAFENFGLYIKRSNSDYRWLKTITNSFISRNLVEPTLDNPCLEVPPDICVQQGIYVFIEELDVINSSYYLAYQRCCRNNTISNIENPGQTGAVYGIEITPEAQLQCNNSPVFDNFPPIVICQGIPLNFDHSASDSEGDVLIYEFCAPLAAGGVAGTDNNPGMATDCDGPTPNPRNCLPPFQNVDYKVPQYSALDPIGSTSNVRIHPVTGRITGIPGFTGQYVVGVCVKEYRNGILLSTTQRDFQFNIVVCELNVDAKVYSDSIVAGRNFVINSCGSNTIEFSNLSTKISNIVSYHWEFGLGNNQTFYDSTNRNTKVTFPGIGTYRGRMIVNRYTIGCTDTADISVNIYPEIHADLNYAYDTCIAGPVQFTDRSTTGSNRMTNWNWNFSAGNTSTVPSPSVTFSTPGIKNVRLQVRDINGCKDDTLVSFGYFPVPPLLVIEPSTFNGCAPSDVFFKNLSIPIDSTYDINWDFGDGTRDSVISPLHRFENPGIYSVKITLRSPIGCYTEANFANWITIRESPVANFDYSPEKLSNFNKSIQIEDLSLRASSWQYLFGGKDIRLDREPSYAFKDTGVYTIRQIVTHASGCKDTFELRLDVEPKVTYFIPNAFTPNGDHQNNDFLGKGFTRGMTGFELSVWTRWGERIFITDDPEEGWNGLKDNDGEDMPPGVYVYQLKYVEPRGKSIHQKGFVNLIR